MKKHLLPLLSLVVCITTLISFQPVTPMAAAAAQNDYAAGDIMTFGSYPQAKVTDSALLTDLNTLTPDAQGDVAFGGCRYKRVYFTAAANSYQATNGYNINTVYWFKYEPVEWRVLSDINGEVLAVAQKLLYAKQYHTAAADMTWENCALHSWLNGEFYNGAFSPLEKTKILTSTVVNDNNPDYGTNGGNETQDKLFLLSLSETANADYGFSSSYGTYDTARRGMGTDYAKSSGLYVATESVYAGNSYWWLRSPGQTQQYAAYVNYYGTLSSSTMVNKTYIGVRPALKINKSYDAGEIIEYGSYPQTKVTDAALIANLNAQTLGADSTVNYGGFKYKRVYFTQYTPYWYTGTPNAENSYQDDNGYYINIVYWFKYEPINWRVLFNTGGQLFIMAEKILSSRAYNQVYTNITWETCTMRSWLNNDFYQMAFDLEQRSQIMASAVVNNDNPWYGTDGGSDTEDKIFVLSYNEVMNAAYGFSSSDTADPARKVQGTDYAKSDGLLVSTDSMTLGNSTWWLRSPGNAQNGVGFISNFGSVGSGINNVGGAYVGVRPAMRLCVQAQIIAPKDGSNCVVDGENGFIYGLDIGISSLDNFVDVAAGYELDYVSGANGFGTGTVVHVTLGGQTAESYTIVIFGDLNGDGNIDTGDAGLIVDYENFIIEWDPAEDAAVLKAADLNGDGNADTADAGLIVDFENFILEIDQTTGLAT